MLVLTERSLPQFCLCRYFKAQQLLTDTENLFGENVGECGAFANALKNSCPPSDILTQEKKPCQCPPGLLVLTE